jgi:hypothetical protein
MRWKDLPGWLLAKVACANATARASHFMLKNCLLIFISSLFQHTKIYKESGIE